MFYRVIQLYKAVFPKITPKEKAFVEEILSPSQTNLFYQQSPVEQRHALDVAGDLPAQGLSEDEFHTLMTAALLHDCGKSLFHLYLWQRVFIVLFFHLPFSLQERICLKKNLLTKTIRIHKRHPIWGSFLARKTGATPEVQHLIKHHHKPKSNLGLLLYHADNRN
ncbi:hypothetical protein Sgly_2200 [Syntrophobotulus glycolicus DSM 8271]|uniref:HD domain-containing protein n=1 Tax=Syntrophobotulus glycolicus (strain DSM 8271 / FlGlyR) TaxID=645991 RepID=F0STW6_SYNGF|nr:HD domain-containing protein [Syntrophobotulus glycolicus]ADY56489.1 hypothetical protein Sgly_2200 [Syntrophobotulus glycolicus DSM 8271]